MKQVIGIDLGTRFTCVSTWTQHKTLEIIPDAFGNLTMPSIVAFVNQNKLVGQHALHMKGLSAENIIVDVKRIMGREANDRIIEQVKNMVSYHIFGDEITNCAMIELLDQTRYRPEEITSFLLAEIKRRAQQHLANSHIQDAVITVPAYFNDNQRQATLDAARMAEWNVLKIINEPTAAALAYGVGHKLSQIEKGGNVLVYDLGAGTLDVSLLHIHHGVFRTLAVGGNSHLGGEDLDYLIMNYVIDQQIKKQKTDLSLNAQEKSLLKIACENAKKLLSVNESTIIHVPELNMTQVLTRKKFESISQRLFKMCLKPVQDVLSSAQLTVHDIDDVILVGGSTRIPYLQSLLLTLFAQTKIKTLNSSLNPDHVVSTGASIYGYMMTHTDDPFSQSMMLLDVTPLSLGVETSRSRMNVIIPRNTTIPARKSKLFSTEHQTDATAKIKIFEGERKMTTHNRHIGTFELQGFQPGMPEICITFEIDKNGILSVKALENHSGITNDMIFTSAWTLHGRMSEEDMQRHIDAAKKHHDEEQKYCEKIEQIYHIERLCSSILLYLKTPECHVPEIQRQTLTQNITNHMQVIASSDIMSWSLKRLIQLFNSLQQEYQFIKPTSLMCVQGFEPTHHLEPIDDDVQMPQHDQIEPMKSNIFNLCKTLLSIVHNPISRFETQDKSIMTQYLENVQLWLWTNQSTDLNTYLNKINEMNQFTSQIMNKYNEEQLFEHDSLSARDELKSYCVALEASLQSNVYQLNQERVHALYHEIHEIMAWLIEYPCLSNAEYRAKIDHLDQLSERIYQSSEEESEEQIYVHIDLHKLNAHMKRN